MAKFRIRRSAVSTLPVASDAGAPRPTRRARSALDTLQVVLASVLLPRRTADLQFRGFLLAAATSLLVIALTFGSYLHGALPREGLIHVTSAIVALVATFYLVFRFGLNRAAADPSLTVYQMTAATLVMIYAMYSAEAGTGSVFPVIVLMIYLFGVIRLRTKGLLLFALFILVVHAATIGLRMYLHPAHPDAGMRLLQWFTLAFSLPWFALIGGHVKGLREHLRTALDAAKSSEARLAEAQRIARLGSWSFQPGTMAVHWSQEMYRLYGTDPGKPVPRGAEFLRLVHPDDQRHYRELIRPAVGSGQGFDSEYRIVLPDGEVRWVHVVCEPAFGDDGKTLLLRGTAADVTERKAHESALQQARDEAAAARATLVEAIESLPEAFALFDAEDRLILCNSQYARDFTECSSFEEIADLTFADIVRASVVKGEPIDPEFGNDVDAWVAERVRRHRDPSVKARDVEVAGGRWLRVTERRTSFGGTVGVRTDITEQKLLEQRQAMEHAVTRLLAESESVGQTMREVIRTICETLQWDCGVRWQFDPQDGRLHCVDAWSVSDPAIAAYSAFCMRLTFPPGGSGLICRVIANGEPLWYSDVTREPGFQRAEAAATAGLHGAFAFPIRIGTTQIGAMAFFIRNVRHPDPALLRVLDSIGLQIGQYIERAAAREQLKLRAHYDNLTGLPNRVLFNELLTRAVLKAQRRGSRLAVLFIDLDGFKGVNDRLGHAAGDRLLATFSRRLQACLRASDTIARHSEADAAARLGGDEFVVLVDDVVDPSAISALAARILAAAAKPFDLGGRVGRVSASIGVGIFPDDGRDIDHLIKAADGAMYEAKEAGRNGFRFAAPAVLEEATLAS